MYDIHEFEITGKGVAVAVLVVFALLVGAGFIGYCIGVRNVHDNGSGTQPIANELGQAGTAIENAGAGIEAAAGHAGNVQAGIDNATEQAGYIYGTAKTSTELIGQCQSIIARIRSRGETETK